jgi:hypothetical protein
MTLRRLASTLLVGAFLFLFAGNAEAAASCSLNGAVAYGTGNGTNIGTVTVAATWTITDATNQVAIFLLSVDNTGTDYNFTGTWGAGDAQTDTQFAEIGTVAATGIYTKISYIVNPDAGSAYNFIANWGANRGWRVSLLVCNDVDTGGIFDTADIVTASDADITTGSAVACASGDYVIGLASWDNRSTVSANFSADQLVESNADGAIWHGVAGNACSASPVSFTATAAGTNNSALITVNINQAAAAGGSVPQMMLLGIGAN